MSTFRYQSCCFFMNETYNHRTFKIIVNPSFPKVRRLSYVTVFLKFDATNSFKWRTESGRVNLKQFVINYINYDSKKKSLIHLKLTFVSLQTMYPIDVLFGLYLLFAALWEMSHKAPKMSLNDLERLALQ